MTERAAQRIVSDLVMAGYVSREREGRRNHYTLNLSAPSATPRNAIMRSASSSTSCGWTTRQPSSSIETLVWRLCGWVTYERSRIALRESGIRVVA